MSIYKYASVFEMKIQDDDFLRKWCEENKISDELFDKICAIPSLDAEIKESKKLKSKGKIKKE